MMRRLLPDAGRHRRCRTRERRRRWRQSLQREVGLLERTATMGDRVRVQSVEQAV